MVIPQKTSETHGNFKSISFTQNFKADLNLIHLMSRPKALVAGRAHTCALTHFGEVYCWGNYNYGQLGHGKGVPNFTDDFNELDPVKVVGLNQVETLAAGADNNCALKTDGTVWCWGNGADGQLGNNSLDSSAKPVRVKDLDEVQAIAVFSATACALKKDGTVWCWGSNNYNQIGYFPDDVKASLENPTTEAKPVPIQVENFHDIVAIGLGISSTCAQKNDGSVWCLGDDQENSTPQKVISGGAKTISHGIGHLCGLVEEVSSWEKEVFGWEKEVYSWEKKVYCLGSNFLGQLGRGTRTSEDGPTPIQVPRLSKPKVLKSAFNSSCAIQEDGTLWCWGDNKYHQLGAPIATEEFFTLPQKHFVGWGPIADVAIGKNHLCAIYGEGKIACTGDNRFGQLGNGQVDSSPSEVPVEAKF